MRVIQFQDWEAVLDASGLSESWRRSHAATIRRYLDRLLKCLAPGWQLMAKVMYGGGLRLMELLRLRVKDVDLAEEIVTVRFGKGDKDRFVPLAHVVVNELREHLAKTRIYTHIMKRPGLGIRSPLDHPFPP